MLNDIWVKAEHIISLQSTFSAFVTSVHIWYVQTQVHQQSATNICCLGVQNDAFNLKFKTQALCVS